MVEEKRRNIDPYNYIDSTSKNMLNYKPIEKLKFFKNKQASYDDYKASNNGVYRPFLKTNKKMVVNSSYDGYEMKTALSDNIKDVIICEYAREIELLQKKKHESLMSLKNWSLRCGRQTKGSMMMNKSIKKKMEEVKNPNDYNRFICKLKQLINVPSSDYTRNIAKNQIKKKEKMTFWGRS